MYKETTENKGNSGFAIKSQYPSKEYARYLEYKKCKLQNTLTKLLKSDSKDRIDYKTDDEAIITITEKIKVYEEKIKRLNSFWMYCCDLYYLDEYDMLKNVASKYVYEAIKELFVRKEGLIKETTDFMNKATISPIFYPSPDNSNVMNPQCTLCGTTLMTNEEEWSYAKTCPCCKVNLNWENYTKG